MMVRCLRRMGRYALPLFCVRLFLFALSFHRAPLPEEALQSLQESFFPGCLTGLRHKKAGRFRVLLFVLCQFPAE